MEKKTESIGPKGHMNIWVGDQITAYERAAAQSGGMHVTQHASYLRGIVVGLKLLQDAWLRCEFEDKDKASS